MQMKLSLSNQQALIYIELSLASRGYDCPNLKMQLEQVSKEQQDLWWEDGREKKVDYGWWILVEVNLNAV
jgi:hypothetical protein